jgi:hypothetical protein
LNPSPDFLILTIPQATTSPTALSPFFGVVKGQCETALLDLSKEQQYSSLKVYSVRPAFVDMKNDTEVIEATKSSGRNLGMLKSGVEQVMGPVLRLCWQGIVSPTEELGRFLVNLAMSDGAPFTAQSGVSGEGRTIENEPMRKILKSGK